MTKQTITTKAQIQKAQQTNSGTFDNNVTFHNIGSCHIHIYIVFDSLNFSQTLTTLLQKFEFLYFLIPNPRITQSFKYNDAFFFHWNHLDEVNNIFNKYPHNTTHSFSVKHCRISIILFKYLSCLNLPNVGIQIPLLTRALSFKNKDILSVNS
mmetsp:Transcript_35538/g.31363  ORF Transcript_35538/g.31363 Transcript_35538/m.31363 type:complete len:153 (+) Transcript_35538:147-605(+)